MFEVIGKYDTAKVFASSLEDEAMAQIHSILNDPVSSGAHTRIMADAHAGAGCVIGYTANITDRVIPNLVGVDLGCFTGDTKIPLIDGSQKTLKDLANEKGEFYVYSVNNNGKIVNGKATAKKTRENACLVEVLISGGERIRCTPDHKFMLRDGTYKEAKDLVYKDSLFPLYRTYQSRDGYESLIQPNKKLKSFPTHIIVAQETFGDIEKGKVVHHINGNQFDNRPENLSLLDVCEHNSIHGHGHIERLKSEKFKRDRIELLREKGFYDKSLYEVKKETGIKNITSYMENNKEGFAEVVKNNAIRGGKYFSNKNSDVVMQKKQKLGRVRKVLLKCESFTEKEYNKYRPKNGDLFCNVLDLLKESNAVFEDIINKERWNEVFFNNHKVISVTTLDYKEDVYCLTVEDYHNFALSAGVFVHNCGVLAIKTDFVIEDFGSLEKFDEFVHSRIPTGKETYSYENFKHSLNLRDALLESAVSGELYDSIFEICEKTGQSFEYVINSLGTLGGGNHFCELGKAFDGTLWFFVHSGSRNFGLKVANYWQEKAYKNLNDRKAEIEYIKANYKGKEIEKRIKAIKERVSKETAYLQSEDLEGYLADVKVAQEYAEINRKLIACIIFPDCVNHIESVHNYVDLEHGIIRKGAISAREGEKVVIPLNMKTGCIIGVGLGNPDYNYSAPHGAGRKLARGKAKRTLSMEEFTQSMKGIYSSCVVESTLDESPMAYKDKDDIIEHIKDTVKIQEIIKPIWNFKAK